MFLTFSGLDGSGKSTLIQWTSAYLIDTGKKVKIINMYDHVGTYALIRFLRDHVIKKMLGKKITEEPVTTTDPDRLGLPQAKPTFILSAFYQFFRNNFTRPCIFFIDLLCFLFYRLYYEGLRKRTLIVDRYFYDWLVDVATGKSSLFTSLFLTLLPQPTLAIFVDVPPDEAFKRKPEYTIAYNENRRKNYMVLIGRLPAIRIVKNIRLEQTQKDVELLLNQNILRL